MTPHVSQVDFHSLLAFSLQLANVSSCSWPLPLEITEVLRESGETLHDHAEVYERN